MWNLSSPPPLWLHTGVSILQGQNCYQISIEIFSCAKAVLTFAFLFFSLNCNLLSVILSSEKQNFVEGTASKIPTEVWHFCKGVFVYDMSWWKANNAISISPWQSLILSKILINHYFCYPPEIINDAFIPQTLLSSPGKLPVSSH